MTKKEHNMKEYFTIGSAPLSEECVQVNSNADYFPAMRAELYKYQALLEKRFPIPSDVSACFAIKWFYHDFGWYGEVVIYFDDTDVASVGFACYVDDNLPETWAE